MLLLTGRVMDAALLFKLPGGSESLGAEYQALPHLNPSIPFQSTSYPALWVVGVMEPIPVIPVHPGQETSLISRILELDRNCPVKLKL